MSNLLRKCRWSELSADQREAELRRPAVRADAERSIVVDRIIEQVRAEGDSALRQLTAELDGVEPETLRVTSAEAAAAHAALDTEATAAMDIAIDNITRFHAAQTAQPLRVETAPGVVCEKIVRPINAVGLYVPAGSAPLPSTAIMLAVPARIAGCPVRVICTPPRPDGNADPAVIVAANKCGITNIFKLGGAQAVAAMAYGTETITKVDKIFGPGNAWVTAAKKAVANDPAGAALDMPAGPSEVMVIADGDANPRYVAYDLLSQAEHGPDSQVVLVCTDPTLADRTAEEVRRALPSLPRRAIIEQALRHSLCVVVDDVTAALAIANQYAPEHLILQVLNPRQHIDAIQNAGSVFLGAWTPESVGDYCSGTNHVLPTYGFARNYSGLSVTDFQKQLTFQELTREGLAGLAPTVRTLAKLEGLDAHAKAVGVRLDGDDAS